MAIKRRKCQIKFKQIFNFSILEKSIFDILKTKHSQLMKKLVSFIFTIFISCYGIAQESMTFQAEIANKNGNTLFIKEGRKIIQEIYADSKGVFKATFPIKEGRYDMYDGVEYAQLYLKNGYDLKMTMDAQAFDETIKFQGKGANENNYLAEETRLEQKFDYNKLLASDETDFKKTIAEKQKNDADRMSKSKLDPAFVALHMKELGENIAGLQEYYAQILANKQMNNKPAPNFDYENHKGGKTTLESLKGKYVYVDVWATWCGPCRAEIPSLKKMETDFHDKNIAFVSVSVDADKDHDKWKTFVTEKELSGIQLYAGKTPVSDFIMAFKINTIPRFILIDPTGKVIDADAKRPSDPKLQEQLSSLLQ
jgi:thiol-disulfide isomerase/thioredoxin